MNQFDQPATSNLRANQASLSSSSNWSKIYTKELARNVPQSQKSSDINCIFIGGYRCPVNDLLTNHNASEICRNQYFNFSD